MNLTIKGPFIDKFAATYAFDIDYVEFLVSALRDMSTEIYAGGYRIEQLSQRHMHQYNWNFRVCLGAAENPSIHVAAFNIDPSKRPIRIEFNPSKITSEYLDNAREFFSFFFNDICPNHRRTLAYVTRLDVAIDIVGLLLEEVIIACAHKRKGSIYTGAGGKIETIYNGVRTSRHFLRSYQKPLPLPEQVKRPHRRVRMKPRIRTEVEWQPNMPLSELAMSKSPFGGVTISSLQGVSNSPHLKRHERLHFIDSCFRRGPQAALNSVDNKPDKRRYQQALRNCQFSEISVATSERNWHAVAIGLQNVTEGV